MFIVPVSFFLKTTAAGKNKTFRFQLGFRNWQRVKLS